MEVIASKVCTRCKVDKPRDAFGVRKSGNLASACKACGCVRAKEYAAQNKEAVAARKQAYRASPAGKAVQAAHTKRYAEEHADEMRAKRMAVYQATKDQTREARAAANKVYRERNREEISARRSTKLASDPAHRAKNTERAALWYEANKESASEKAKAVYKENRDHIKQRVAAYQKARPEETRMYHRVKAHRRRERLRASGEKFTKDDIDRLMALQRKKCACCHACLSDGFHIDHRTPVAKGGTNNPMNLELLCPTCNMAKADKLPHVFAQEQGRLL